MNSLTIIECLIIGFVLLLQTRQGLKTGQKIRALACFIPDNGFFKVKRGLVSKTIMEELSTLEIVNNFETHAELEEESGSDQTIALINPGELPSSQFGAVLEGLNRYLLRNKGSATDFNLVKDTVERHVQVEENQINQGISTPLYLGLIGTMLGIIVGLANLYFYKGMTAQFDEEAFLFGVSIAMLASLYGLAWTVFNSSTRYKKAKYTLEKAKNDFYTFIQSELLSELNQSVSASVSKLSKQLLQFNAKFENNLNRLDQLVMQNYAAIQSQENVMSILDEIDLVEFAKANGLIFSELKDSISSLKQFNTYLDALSQMTTQSENAANALYGLLDRTNNFETTAQKLDNRIELSNQLLEFLSTHFRMLEKNGAIVRGSVTQVGDIMGKSLDELKDYTQLKMDAIKEMIRQEEVLLAKSFSENKTHFSKLGLLSDMNDLLKQILDNANQNDGENQKLLEQIKEGLAKNNGTLIKMKRQPLWASLRNIFRRKNGNQSHGA